MRVKTEDMSRDDLIDEVEMLERHLKARDDLIGRQSQILDRSRRQLAALHGAGVIQIPAYEALNEALNGSV